MLSLTRLLGGAAPVDQDLRYGASAGTRRVGALPGTGPVVVWNWTRHCNLSCVHCYANAVRHRPVGELDSAEATHLLAQCAELRVPALLLSGGEPLARPDALDLLQEAGRLGLRCTLSTNGTLIDAPRARALAQAQVRYVGVSLDGPPEVHDRWRGREGAHARTVAAIRRLREVGVPVGLRFTLQRDSLQHVPYLLDLAEREGVRRVCLYHLVPAGRGAELASMAPSRAAIRACLEGLLIRARRWLDEGREIDLLTVGNHSDGAFVYLWLSEQAPERAATALALLARNGGNRSGVALLAVGPTGDVQPDQFSQGVLLGNVRQEPLGAIWRQAPALAELRGPRQQRIGGRCQSCAWFRICNGNLRARAAAAGDPWGEDPGCVLEDAELASPAAVALG